MNIYAIHDICRYPKSIPTLRKKLQKLIKMNLIKSASKYVRTQECGGGESYKVFERRYSPILKTTKDLTTDDVQLCKVGFVRESDMLMLGSEARYILAAILNKFHYMSVDENIGGTYLSCNEIIQMLSGDVDRESVRRYLCILEREGHITFIHRRQGAKFGIKFTDKLKSYKLREVIAKSAEDVVKAFTAYRKVYFAEDAASAVKKSWLKTVVEFLEYEGGREYQERRRVLLAIIAYLAKDKEKRLEVDLRSPSSLFRKWNDLASEALKLSKKWVKKFLDKLINGKIPVGEELEPPQAEQPKENIEYGKYFTLSEAEKYLKTLPKDNQEKIWEEVLEWRKELSEFKFKNLWRSQRVGVGSVDFEDYMARAQDFMLVYTIERHRGKLLYSDRDKWLTWRLQDYMYNNRCVDRSKGADKAILQVSVGDFDVFLRKYELIIPEVEYTEVKFSDEVRAALGNLKRKNRAMLLDYFGIKGERYTYDELAIKYKCAKNNAWEIVQSSIKQLRRMLDPPKT